MNKHLFVSIGLSLSAVLQEIDVILYARDLTDQQQLELGDLVKHCQSVLEELDKTLNKFKELDPVGQSSDGKPRRVWKRFKWDQKDIDEFRSRISSNVLLLNTFLGRVSR
jgi:peptidoglycan hydrolase CwlO-like protein